jgi:glutamate dehydrogenase/leucine dehydrogenase
MMGPFEYMAGEFEQVVYNHDARTGLRAIIAIHSTALGPALGGTRFYPYASEADGLRDVLRLARGMTYKAAAAGLDLGGGKAVILGDPRTDRSEALLRAYGRFVDALGGRYVTAEDVGTTTDDMDLIARETAYVTGRSASHAGSSGDPSEMTAFGVYHGLRAVAATLWGEEALGGRHVVVQGVGKVGARVCRLLARDGARLTVADVDAQAARDVALEVGGTVADPGKVHAIPCDVFSPCALGAVVNDETLPELACAAVAGAANNVLERPEHGAALHAAGIVYAPDYVINAGGVINIADELSGGYSPERARGAAARIYDRVRELLEHSAAEDAPPSELADRMAAERIRSIGRLTSIRIRPTVRA